MDVATTTTPRAKRASKRRPRIIASGAACDRAMKAGPFKTKKEAVEAGLRLLARQADYREILKWEGKLKWEGDESIDWTKPDAGDADGQQPATVLTAAEPGAGTRRGRR